MGLFFSALIDFRFVQTERCYFHSWLCFIPAGEEERWSGCCLDCLECGKSTSQEGKCNRYYIYTTCCGSAVTLFLIRLKSLRVQQTGLRCSSGPFAILCRRFFACQRLVFIRLAVEDTRKGIKLTLMYF